MPFFFLPLELREEVYGYVKFPVYADRIRVPKIEVDWNDVVWKDSPTSRDCW